MNDRQLLFDLPAKTTMTRADFLPTSSNQQALDAIGAWGDWPGNRLLLTGPNGSGRTHLLNIWVVESGASHVMASELRTNTFRPSLDAVGFAIDDADELAGDPVAEEALFHLYNHAQNRGLPILLSAGNMPGVWGLGLPDLLSRMQSCPTVGLHAPDDALLGMALVKLCDDRQLAVSDEIIRYLLPRMERSLRAAHDIVEALDQAALLAQRKVTRTLASQVLSSLDSMKNPG